MKEPTLVKGTFDMSKLVVNPDNPFPEVDHRVLYS